MIVVIYKEEEEGAAYSLSVDVMNIDLAFPHFSKPNNANFDVTSRRLAS